MAEWFSAEGGSASGGKAGERNILYLVYVIKSIPTSKLYIGYTDNIGKRLAEHNRGKVKSTKSYLPYRLVYKEEYSNKTEARKRELFLKTGKGREFIKAEVD